MHTDTPDARTAANPRTHASARTRVTPTRGGCAPAGLRPPYAPPTCGNSAGRADPSSRGKTRISGGRGEKVGACRKKVAKSFGGSKKNAYLCRRMSNLNPKKMRQATLIINATGVKRRVHATTDHPDSHYGIPVWVDDDNVAYCEVDPPYHQPFFTVIEDSKYKMEDGDDYKLI